MTSKGEESAIESGVYGCEVCVEVGLCMSVWASRCVCGVYLCFEMCAALSLWVSVCLGVYVSVCAHTCDVWRKGLRWGLRAPVTRVWRRCEIWMESRAAPRFAGLLSQMKGPEVLTQGVDGEGHRGATQSWGIVRAPCESVMGASGWPRGGWVTAEDGFGFPRSEAGGLFIMWQNGMKESGWIRCCFLRCYDTGGKNGEQAGAQGFLLVIGNLRCPWPPRGDIRSAVGVRVEPRVLWAEGESLGGLAMSTDWANKLSLALRP